MSLDFGMLQHAIIEATQKVTRETIKAAVPEIERLIQQQFDEGKDPYGKPWAPLKPSTLRRGRRPPPLTDTRAMRDGIKVRGIEDGISIDVPASYASFHQEGAPKVNLAARPMLPEHGLPESWEQAITSAAESVVRGSK